MNSDIEKNLVTEMNVPQTAITAKYTGGIIETEGAGGQHSGSPDFIKKGKQVSPEKSEGEGMNTARFAPDGPPI